MTFIQKWVEYLALWTALAGGVVLVSMAIMVVLSVSGRALTGFGFSAIPGDFELVEAGTGFAVCAFMPWTQLNRGHASVSVVADAFSNFINAVIDLFSELTLFVIAVFITWRLWAGMLDKMNFGETTFILKFPLWWSYAGCLFGLGVWILVGGWSTVFSIIRIAKGNFRRIEGAVVH